MRWIIALTGLLLMGCVYSTGGYYGPRATSINQVDLMVGLEQPVAYRVGFQAGCDSGYVFVGNTAYTPKRDVQRYDVDSQYKQGWNDGYNRCRGNPGPYSGASYSSGYYYGPDYYYGFYPGLYWSSRHNYRSNYYYPYGSGIYYGTHYYSPYYSPRLQHYKRRHHGGGHRASSYNFKALYPGSQGSSSYGFKAFQPKSYSGSGKVHLRHQDRRHSKGFPSKSRGHGKKKWKKKH